MLKKLVVNNAMRIIKGNYPNYAKEELEKIQYGLEAVYLSVTKIIVVIILSIVLNIFKETVLLLLFFNLLRMTAFGIHASKSWICWVTSIPTFIGIPLICKYVVFSDYILIILSIFSLISFVLFAPADTVKRPLIRKNRRRIYKLLTIIISIPYIFVMIFINNSFLKNTITLAMLIESVLISPLTYKLFKMPYNNYKTYKKRV